MNKMIKDSKEIKKLISKVKNLAERGDNGERDNAKAKLKILLEKYNIKKFEEAKKKERSFKLSDFTDCKVIMVHCILDTNKDCQISGDARKKELYCKLTDEEYIDVCEKFNHYYPEYYSQKECFLNAFIIKNDLGIVDSNIDSSDIDVDGLKEVMESVIKNKYKKTNLGKDNPYLLAC
jgi:hypothetical protein